jgi:hypothetical protein
VQLSSPAHGNHLVPLVVVYLSNQAKDSGQLAPTKKGVSLSSSEWAAVQAVLPHLQQAVDVGNDQFSAELPNNLRATTSTFQ